MDAGFPSLRPVNVLAFDTCFGAVSAAVRWQSDRGEWLLREAYEPMAIGHAERLLPVIDEVMGGAGLTYDRLDRIAVTLGPGSFTGLRVGIAAARAMALATSLPVVGISSLAAIAERADFLLGAKRQSRPIVVAVDARREAVYIEIFDAADAKTTPGPKLLTVSEAIKSLPPGNVIVVGTAAHLMAAAASRTDVEVQLSDLQPHARQIAQLAATLSPLSRVTPLYLRAADAKPSAAPPLSRRSGS